MHPLEKQGFEKRVGAFVNEGESSSVVLAPCFGHLEVDDRLSRGRVKTAASESALAAASKIEPHPDRVYLLVVGLGSREFWSDNKNGDGFPEAGLLGKVPDDVPMSFFDRFAGKLPKAWGHETFRSAHTFEEHRNHDPKLAIGGVEDTFWNDAMHRVENIIHIDRKKGREWARKADAGLPLATSMACRVPFDRCSRCGNLAATKSQYCEHLKPGTARTQLRHVAPDGTSIAMLNDFPVFFDESMVKNPAAPEALCLMKIASTETETAPAEAPPTFEKLAGAYLSENRLPETVLVRLRDLGLPATLGAMRKLAMALRPSEMLKVAFDKTSADPDALDRAALVLPIFDHGADVAFKSASTQVTGTPDPVKLARALQLLAPFERGRSYDPTYLVPRLAKCASRPVPVGGVSEAEALFIGMYHALYKAASGEFGIGPAWLDVDLS